MIIHRYVLREISQNFIAVLAVLLLIYTSNRFVRYMGEAAAGKLSSELIMELLLLKALSNLVLLLPLALYIAVLIALGRLYKDSEIVAMIAGGIGLPTLAQGILWLALVMAGAALVLSLFVSPYVAGLQAELLAKAREESDITGIYPGRFKILGEADKGDGEKTVYVEKIAPDGHRMHNVFAQLRKGEREAVLVSALAYQRLEGPEARRYIVLEDGYRYVGRPGDAAYEVTRFAKHALLVDPGTGQPAFRKHDAFPTMELIASDHRRHKAELQWRLSLPISVVVLSMLAVPLARTSPRQGKYSKLFTAFLIYFAYNNAVGVCQKLVERGDIPPAVGVWPVHIAMMGLVLGLLALQSAAPLRLRRLRRYSRRD